MTQTLPQSPWALSSLALSRSLALGALALSCALGTPAAEAGPRLKPAKVIERLVKGDLPAEEGAGHWRKSRVKPRKALKLLGKRKIRSKRGPGFHEIDLKDGFKRASTAFLKVPKQPRADGRYGVVIMLHGLGGNGKKVFELAASLCPEGSIIVGPTALKPNKDESCEDLPPGDLSKLISRQFPRWWSYGERSFPLQALRYLRSTFPIDPNRVVLIGYSMGGFGSWNIGLRYHDLFAGAAPMAGGISRQEYFLGRDNRSRHLLGNARQLPLWILHGDSDEVVPVRLDRNSVKDLKARGLPFTYKEVKGGKHVMRDQLEDGPIRRALIEFITTKVRDPHPVRVEHHAINATHGGAYWVRIDELRGKKARVVAVSRDQTIQVVCEGVAKLTLFADPTLIDATKPVRFVINGQEVHTGRLAPTLKAIASSLARTGDAELTYAHALTFTTPEDLPAPDAEDWKLGLEIERPSGAGTK
ncbi:MAG: dienelactone hydrolase family protein [Planctomycetes bacterium]|nr:dienelactone hydrolase family protein [Planctomycetota bacterium]